MTLPCGHTPAEHEAFTAHREMDARERLIGWVRASQDLNPRDWPEALAEMADLLICDLTGDTRAQVWTQRAAAWPDRTLVVLVALTAAACNDAAVDPRAIAREGRRLKAEGAVDVTLTAMAHYRGGYGLAGPLSSLINHMTDWEAFNVVHFGRSAIMTIGLGAPDLLALIDAPGHDASGI